MNLADKLLKQLDLAHAQVNALTTYPDLEEFTDRWGQTHLVSKQINKKVDKFEVRNECDCCNYVNVYLMPFIEFEGVRIHSNPCQIVFATKYNDGVAANEFWQDSLYDMGCSDTFMDKVSEWLKLHDKDYDEDDYA